METQLPQPFPPTPQFRKAVLRTDGASKGNPGPSSIGLVLHDNYGTLIDRYHEHIGHSSNNVAEYQALLTGIKRAKALNVTHLDCYTDSQVLQRHLIGQYKVQNPELVNLVNEIKKEIQPLEHFHIAHVRRYYNKEADKEANLAFVKDKIKDQTISSLDSFS